MDNTGNNLLQQVSDALAAAVDNGRQGIVQVHARRRLPATGIIWQTADDANADAPTLIVTASHVVERDEDISVSDAEGNEYPARLLGRDHRTDIALLAVDGPLGSALPRSTDANVGSLVLAIGSVGGTRATLSTITGLTSGRRGRGGRGPGRHGHGHGRRRGFGGGRGRGIELIASNVVMLPGFSGGPLVDVSGNVLGMLSSHIGHGEAFAVPVATIDAIVASLSTYGHMRQGSIGIAARSIRLDSDLAELADSRGALLVTGVLADRPAAAAGVLVGDLLVAIDEYEMTSYENLLDALRGERIGEEVTLRILRGGAVQELSAVVDERPSEG